MDDTRLKKLRGSGGYVMAKVTDEQQARGNLGGPDLFLAPVGRLPESDITRYFCNTCEKESEGAPAVEFESPGEVVADNLVLVERGRYKCSCGSTIAEYREFKKQDEQGEVGAARTAEQLAQQSAQVAPQVQQPAQQAPPAQVAQPAAQPAAQQATQPAEQAPEIRQGAGDVGSIEGRDVIDGSANRIGTARRVGIDQSQSMVLVMAGPDGSESSIPWSSIKKVGDVILLGAPDAGGAAGAKECCLRNKPGSRFCEECGSKL
ncbi:conserved hypothetical protein [Nitrosopumilaceae archaeon]|nr:hypothetical protein [Nitrosopumilus sp.]MDA7945468.1 hypothetical protein [Nitrosopumilus sp.]MDA7955236.1 hypothetical protein [Nitrosopumilus sp.]MDA7974011.1 hypothetical protein [Nitrosopumilus sp.]CAI9831469.1 conserved hypothetical protein [Nitrosopumilaceae archaeon]